jgi:hypothetical protein
VYFLSEEARGSWGVLAVDIRDTRPQSTISGETGHLWHLDVTKNFSLEGPDDAVILAFAGVNGLPDDVEVMLVDRTLGRIQNLREETSYRFYSGKRERKRVFQEARFSILVGDAEFVDGGTRQDRRPPSHTRLYQNYPNPFPQATVIRYELARAGPVEIRIHDVSGRLVNTLSRVHDEPGRYEVAWSGDDRSGRQVAPGVYFYRLISSELTQARKMIRVR